MCPHATSQTYPPQLGISFCVREIKVVASSREVGGEQVLVCKEHGGHKRKQGHLQAGGALMSVYQLYSCKLPVCGCNWLQDVRTHVYMSVCYAHVRACVCVCVSAHSCVCMCVLCVCMCVCMCVCVYAWCMFACSRVRVRVCVRARQNGVGCAYKREKGAVCGAQ